MAALNYSELIKLILSTGNTKCVFYIMFISFIGVNYRFIEICKINCIGAKLRFYTKTDHSPYFLDLPLQGLIAPPV